MWKPFRKSAENLLSNRSSSSNKRGNGTEAQLMAACTRGDVPEAAKLLKEGSDACHRGEFGATPLTRAAEQGHAAIVATLLKHGSKVNAQDDNGDSALLCACRMGHLEAVRVLLGAGADPGLANSQGCNALDASLEARNLLGRPEVSELRAVEVILLHHVLQYPT